MQKATRTMSPRMEEVLDVMRDARKSVDEVGENTDLVVPPHLFAVLLSHCVNPNRIEPSRRSELRQWASSVIDAMPLDESVIERFRSIAGLKG